MGLAAATHVQNLVPADIEAILLDGSINIAAGFAILVLGWVISIRAAKLTHAALDRLGHFDETLKPLVTSFVRYTILSAAIVAVLGRFGVETTSIITLLGAAGLAVGLALQGTLSNVAAGVMILLLRPFRIGDAVTVTAQNQSGTVREIGLFTTILVSADLAVVWIPNSQIFSNVIVNTSREPNTRINFTVAVDYANDIDAAMKIIMDVVSADARVLKDPPPATGVQELKENAVELLVRCWVHNADGEAARFALQKAIRDRFRDAAIAIPVRRQLATAQSETLAPQRVASR